ncbi:hypothetical protein CE91St62_15470 [Lachnospiraceae bacterium]|nr:hypothetical protein CE91St61_15570 [Lachnospiraceae bacterium]BDF37486.1 hypothetical protein CE91St62_15470 [Lachnospiraceae bacterium]
MRPGTATITQIPKPVECSPIAALTPQAKESGEDSPSLPLIPAHLSHTSPAAIYFTSTGGDGCVALSADGRALLCQHIDKGLSKLKPFGKKKL